MALNISKQAIVEGVKEAGRVVWSVGVPAAVTALLAYVNALEPSLTTWIIVAVLGAVYRGADKTVHKSKDTDFNGLIPVPQLN